MNARFAGVNPLIGPWAPPPPAESPPRVLFVGFSGDPGSDRIVADMGELGAECAVVAPKSSFPTRSRYAARVFPTPNWRWAPLRALAIVQKLEAIAAEGKPDLIAPLDEVAAVALRDPRLYSRVGPALRRVIANSLGDSSFYAVATSRRAAMRLARSLGLTTPREVDAPNFLYARWAASAFGYPVVVKRDLTCDGRGVAIASDEEELKREYRRLWRDAQTMRLVGEIPGYRSAGYPYLTVQEFIPGSLACRVAASADGRELEGVEFLAVKRDPLSAGPNRFLRAISQPEMVEASRRLIAALKVSGVVSLNFILTQRGEAHLVAFHPCPPPIGHLGQWFGHDIHGALLRNLGWNAQRAPRGGAPATIALFPHAIDGEPKSPDLEPGSGVFHDVPWDDPEVLAAYRAWLDERHPNCAPVLAAHGGGIAARSRPRMRFLAQ